MRTPATMSIKLIHLTLPAREVSLMSSPRRSFAAKKLNTVASAIKTAALKGSIFPSMKKKHQPEIAFDAAAETRNQRPRPESNLHRLSKLSEPRRRRGPAMATTAYTARKKSEVTRRLAEKVDRSFTEAK
jgi:hypothetical protein